MNTNSDFLSYTVNNFRNLGTPELARLCAELGLSMTEQERVLCREQYRLREGRDPTVWELRFLDRFIATCHAQASTLCAKELRTQNEDYVRAWKDVARQRREMAQADIPSLGALASTCGAYLARAGIGPRDTRLVCDTTAALAARCAGVRPTLLLDLGGIAAMHLPPAPPRPTNATVILTLSPTGNESFAAEIERFFIAHRAPGISALCVCAACDLLPHLLSLNGITLDVDKLPEGEGEQLLLLAPEAAIPTLFATGAPLTLLGTCNTSGRLLLCEGTAMRTSQDIGFLRRLASVRHMLSATVESTAPCTIAAPQIVENASMRLGGTRTEEGLQHALLALLCALGARGTRLSRATLCSVLELPRAADASALNAALPLLLELHRTTAELAIPALPARVITAACERPALSVFLSAPCAKPTETAALELQSLATARDFAAMRRHLAENF